MSARVAVSFVVTMVALAAPIQAPAAAGTSGVTREWGANRFATAANIALTNFSAGVDVVYIATGRNFPDALAAVPSASLDNGPVLLVELNSIPQPTADALNTLQPDRIVIAGGPGVVSDAVAAQLENYVPGVASGVTREWGVNRFATAAEIALENFSAGVDVVYIATGRNFPDALAAGPAASLDNGPVLLVELNSIPQPTDEALNTLQPDRIVIAGGPGVVSNAVAAQLEQYIPGTASGVTREWGLNRYGTAANIATTNFTAPVPVAYVATGANFPDALAAGPAAAKLGGPVLLVTLNSIPAETAAALDALDPARIVIAGGSGVVSDAVAAQLENYVGSGPANRPPVAGDDTASVNEDSGANTIQVLVNDSDPDGDALAVSAASNPPNGTTAIPAGGGSVTYTPDANYSGPDSFTYTVRDPDGATDMATVNVTVIDTADNQAPVAGDDNGGTVAGGCWLLVRGVLGNDTDPNGDVLTITDSSDSLKGRTELVSTPGGMFIRYINEQAPGAFTQYTDAFTYTVSDPAGATDTATVTMTVNGWADTDGDGINNACDPFAKASDAGADAALGFAEEFNDGSGDWNGTALTGVMTNSIEDSLTQVTTNTQSAGGRLLVTTSDGEAFGANNTQDNGFQVNIATSPALPDFSIQSRVCQPFPPQDFASAGIFFGPGDQENYIKAALDWHPTLDVTSVADTREVDGHGVTIARRTAHRGDPSVALPDCIDLLVNVRPSAGTYHPHYSLNGGTCWYGFGGTTGRTVPANWLNGTYPLGGTGGNRALAVGVISSSIGPSDSFNATFDFLKVDPMITTTICP